jgi:hypothetical protein
MKHLSMGFLILYLILVFTGCSSPFQSVNIEYNVLYEQVVGFSINNNLMKPITEDVRLLTKDDEYQSFVNEHFVSRELPVKPHTKGNAVLYVQMKSNATTVQGYGIERISYNNNVLEVSLYKNGNYGVDPAAGFDGVFKWIMLIEIDKTQINSKTRVEIKYL